MFSFATPSLGLRIQMAVSQPVTWAAQVSGFVPFLQEGLNRISQFYAGRETEGYLLSPQSGKACSLVVFASSSKGSPFPAEAGRGVILPLEFPPCSTVAC